MKRRWSLKGWIDLLEGAENPNKFKRSLTRKLRLDSSENDLRKSNADNRAVRDAVAHRLTVLWSDVGFWKFIQGLPKPTAIRAYIAKNHRLLLPPFPAAVWWEMVTDQQAREHLFLLLRARPGVFAPAAATEADVSALEEFRSRGAGAVLLRYLEKPGTSKRSLLRKFQISDATWQRVRAALKRFDEDMDWCLKNPDAQKPGSHIFPRKGQEKSPEAIECLTRMVDIVLSKPTETNDALARHYLSQYWQRPELFDLTEVKKYASLASEAKSLIEVRERIPVKHHLDPAGKHGRKPRRKKT